MTQKVEPPMPVDPFAYRSLDTKINRNGELTDVLYTAANSTTVRTSAEGRRFEVVSDDFGRPLRKRWAKRLAQEFSYDARGRLASTNQGSRREKYDYDEHGNLQTITNSAGESRQYFYDDADRVKRAVDPEGHALLYDYDRNGNLITLTPAGRRAQGPTGERGVHYEYNLDKQIKLKRMPSGEEIHFVYGGPTDRLEKVTFGSGELRYFYLSGNRLARLESSQGVDLDFDYYGALPKSETLHFAKGGGGSVELAFDPWLRIGSATLTVANLTSTTEYKYDHDGDLRQAGAEILARDLDSGAPRTITLHQLRETLVEDQDFGEFKSTTVEGPSGLLFGEEVDRDLLGRIRARREKTSAGETLFEYTYDLGGHVATVKENGQVSADFSYDENGNRAPGSYDLQDRLVQDAIFSYEYGTNGELRSMTNLSTREVTSFAFDVFGNLRSVDSGRGGTVEYLSDGLQRRVEKRRNGKVVQRYILPLAAAIGRDAQRRRHVAKRVYLCRQGPGPPIIW